MEESVPPPESPVLEESVRARQHAVEDEELLPPVLSP
jgi:hypothetical protein